MLVANVLPHATTQIITAIIPVPTPVIRRFSNPNVCNLVFNSDEEKDVTYEKHIDVSKSSNSRHAPNVNLLIINYCQ